MKTLVLHGSLKDQFGERFDFQHATAQGVVKGVAVQMPGLMLAIREGRFHLVLGKVEGDRPDGIEFDETTMHMAVPDGEVHLVPAIEGRGGGFFQTIVGVALVVGSFFIGGPGASALVLGLSNAAFGLGVSLALSGLSQLIAPTPDLDSNEVDKKTSFLINSQKNRSRSGEPVPLVFGRMRVGGVVFSLGFDTEELGDPSEDGSDSDKFLGGLNP